MKGVTDDETYLYVRGHELFDHILYSVLNPVITRLRNQHYTLEHLAKMKKLVKKPYENIRQKDNPVKKLLSKNYRYKNNTLIYKQIWADVMQIWM